VDEMKKLRTRKEQASGAIIPDNGHLDLVFAYFDRATSAFPERSTTILEYFEETSLRYAADTADFPFQGR
jgi:hypothetical protein